MVSSQEIGGIRLARIVQQRAGTEIREAALDEGNPGYRVRRSRPVRITARVKITGRRRFLLQARTSLPRGINRQMRQTRHPEADLIQRRIRGEIKFQSDGIAGDHRRPVNLRLGQARATLTVHLQQGQDIAAPDHLGRIAIGSVKPQFRRRRQPGKQKTYTQGRRPGRVYL